MSVNFHTRSIEVAMSRIGGQACTSCNDEFSSLEGLARSVMERIQNGTDLTDPDLRVLLDWLDKVRIGLWLWLLTFSAQSARIKPRFQIATRVGRKGSVSQHRQISPNE